MPVGKAEVKKYRQAHWNYKRGTIECLSQSKSERSCYRHELAREIFEIRKTGAKLKVPDPNELRPKAPRHKYSVLDRPRSFQTRQESPSYNCTTFTADTLKQTIGVLDRNNPAILGKFCSICSDWGAHASQGNSYPGWTWDLPVPARGVSVRARRL
jgi:hypothetical protein